MFYDALSSVNKLFKNTGRGQHLCTLGRRDFMRGIQQSAGCKLFHNSPGRETRLLLLLYNMFYF